MTRTVTSVSQNRRLGEQLGAVKSPLHRARASARPHALRGTSPCARALSPRPNSTGKQPRSKLRRRARILRLERRCAREFGA